MDFSGRRDEARPWFSGPNQIPTRSRDSFPKDHVDLETVAQLGYPQPDFAEGRKRFVSPQISFVSRKIGFLRLLGSGSVDINSLPLTARSGLTLVFGKLDLRFGTPVGKLGISVPKHMFSLVFFRLGHCG
jgi:hypothetical protein